MSSVVCSTVPEREERFRGSARFLLQVYALVLSTIYLLDMHLINCTACHYYKIAVFMYIHI